MDYNVIAHFNDLDTEFYRVYDNGTVNKISKFSLEEFNLCASIFKSLGQETGLYNEASETEIDLVEYFRTNTIPKKINYKTKTVFRAVILTDDFDFNELQKRIGVYNGITNQQAIDFSELNRDRMIVTLDIADEIEHTIRYFTAVGLPWGKETVINLLAYSFVIEDIRYQHQPMNSCILTQIFLRKVV